MTYLPNSGRVNLTIGGNTAGVGSLVSTGTATLVGGNNITLSQNGNAITISGGAGGGAAFTAGMSTIGNTAGTSGTVSNQLIFAGGNNITLSQSTGVGGNTISISGATTFPAFSAGINTLGNTSGTTGMVSNQLVFAGGNNITLSQSTGAGGNTITIIGTSGGGGGGVALANSQTTFSSGTVNLVASGALTIGSAAQSFNLSVPQTSSLSATGAMSISTNGSTISLGVPAFSAGITNAGNTTGTSGTVSNQLIFAGGNNITLSQSTGAGGNTVTISGGLGGATLSRFEYMEGVFMPLTTAAPGSLSFNHQYIPFNVTGTAMKIGGSLSVFTSASVTTATASVSLWMGIYTLNGSTLSLASSGSANNSFQWAQSSNTTANTSINGMRELTVPMNVNMKPGEYWIAAVMSSSTNYTSMAYTMFGNSLLPATAILSPIGNTLSRDAMLFQGIYTAATTAGPTSVVSSAINNTSASNVMRANFYDVIYNATY
jgi:hypothetical protein